jgi:hypothetical protein
MVVIVIIGILAVVAAPSMRLTTYERHAYNDAGAIMQLFRGAHSRAVAYSLPVLVSMSASGSTYRGTFVTYVAAAPVLQGAGTRTLVSCRGPWGWAPVNNTNANLRQVDFVNLNGTAGTAEVEADIETTINYFDGANAPLAAGSGYMCFTPLGRSYVGFGATPSAVFDGLLPNVFPLEAKVQRLGAGGGAVTRSVLVLPNGTSRIFSHTW